MVPEWVGSVLFLAAAALSGVKIGGDFGDRGLRGYAVLVLLVTVYAGAVGLAFS